MKRIPGTVLALGAVSLLTDLSSEMIYPLLPLFLTTALGAGPLALGFIEGLAESTASVLKLGSGLLADRFARRKPLILVGYGLSGLLRPLVGLAASWPAVAAIRFADRIGKGLRSSPRDALIADVTPSEIRGRAFGLHRSMDHAGAVLGPLVAAGLLLLGLELRTIFLLAAVPAALVILTIVFGVREAPRQVSAAQPILADLKELPLHFWHLLGAILLFTLGNSSDAFLLLALSKAGLPAAWVALLWAAHHVVKMVSSYLGGGWSDRFGRKRLLIHGWIVYAAVYAAFALFGSLPALIGVFLVYGIYFGLTEGTERAWVADLAPKLQRGAAFGAYNAAIGLGALPASLLFGLLWGQFGKEAAFLTGAGLALLASAALSSVPERAPA